MDEKEPNYNSFNSEDKTGGQNFSEKTNNGDNHQEKSTCGGNLNGCPFSLINLIPPIFYPPKPEQNGSFPNFMPNMFSSGQQMQSGQSANESQGDATNFQSNGEAQKGCPFMQGGMPYFHYGYNQSSDEKGCANSMPFGMFNPPPVSDTESQTSDDQDKQIKQFGYLPMFVVGYYLPYFLPNCFCNKANGECKTNHSSVNEKTENTESKGSSIESAETEISPQEEPTFTDSGYANISSEPPVRDSGPQFGAVPPYTPNAENIEDTALKPNFDDVPNQAQFDLNEEISQYEAPPSAPPLVAPSVNQFQESPQQSTFVDEIQGTNKECIEALEMDDNDQEGEAVIQNEVAQDGEIIAVEEERVYSIYGSHQLDSEQPKPEYSQNTEPESEVESGYQEQQKQEFNEFDENEPTQDVEANFAPEVELEENNEGFETVANNSTNAENSFVDAPHSLNLEMRENFFAHGTTQTVIEEYQIPKGEIERENFFAQPKPIEPQPSTQQGDYEKVNVDTYQSSEQSQSIEREKEEETSQTVEPNDDPIIYDESYYQQLYRESLLKKANSQSSNEQTHQADSSNNEQESQVNSSEQSELSDEEDSFPKEDLQPQTYQESQPQSEERQDESEEFNQVESQSYTEEGEEQRSAPYNEQEIQPEGSQAPQENDDTAEEYVEPYKEFAQQNEYNEPYGQPTFEQEPMPQQSASRQEYFSQNDTSIPPQERYEEVNDSAEQENGDVEYGQNYNQQPYASSYQNRPESEDETSEDEFFESGAPRQVNDEDEQFRQGQNFEDDENVTYNRSNDYGVENEYNSSNEFSQGQQVYNENDANNNYYQSPYTNSTDTEQDKENPQGDYFDSSSRFNNANSFDGAEYSKPQDDLKEEELEDEEGYHEADEPQQERPLLNIDGTPIEEESLGYIIDDDGDEVEDSADNDEDDESESSQNGKKHKGFFFRRRK